MEKTQCRNKQKFLRVWRGILGSFKVIRDGETKRTISVGSQEGWMAESCNSPANHRARESWAQPGPCLHVSVMPRPTLSVHLSSQAAACFLMLGSVLMLFLCSTFRGFHLNYVKFHIHKPPRAWFPSDFLQDISSYFQSHEARCQQAPSPFSLVGPDKGVGLGPNKHGGGHTYREIKPAYTLVQKCSQWKAKLRPRICILKSFSGNFTCPLL